MKKIVWGIAAATVLMAQQRFDLKVREDFFVGFAGNRAALDVGKPILAAAAFQAASLLVRESLLLQPRFEGLARSRLERRLQP